MAEGEDYGDEDFEDYDDDDFEDDEEAAPSPKKASAPQPVSTKSPAKKTKSKDDPPTPKGLDPAVLEMRRAMEKENESSAKNKAAPSPTKQKPGNKHAPAVRQSVRSSQELKSSGVEAEPENKKSSAPARKIVAPGGQGSSAPKLPQSDRVALAKRRAKRDADLLKSGRVKLGMTDAILLDMSPLTKYELFARGYTRGNKESTGAQCPDDARTRDSEVQCQPISKAHLNLQVPEDLATRSQYERLQQREQAKQNIGQGGVGSNLIGQDSSRLSSFLLRVEPVVTEILKENADMALRRQGSMKAFEAIMKNPETSFSSNSMTMTATACKEVLKGRKITNISLQGESEQFICVCYDRKPGENTSLDMMGLIGIWRAEEASAPKYLLACHVTPSTLGLITHKTFPICVTGSLEGNLNLWDLRESAEPENFLTSGGSGETGPEQKWKLPTYNTDVTDVGEMHQHLAPVVAIQVLISEDSSTFGVQVVSLDEEGKILIWTVMSLQNYDEDPCLSFGGRLKLLKSGVINLYKENTQTRAERLWSLARARSMTPHPVNSNLFFVGSESGYVLLKARYGAVPAPNKFRPEGVETSSSISTVDAGGNGVTAVSISPFEDCAPQPKAYLMLVGRENGSVSLYSTARSQPLRTWYVTGEVRKVAWSPTRPAVFVVLDSTSRLYFFLLLEKQDGPVLVENVDSSQVETIDVAALKQGSGKTDKVGMVVAFGTGHIQMHLLQRKYSEAIVKEEELLSQKLSEF